MQPWAREDRGAASASGRLRSAACAAFQPAARCRRRFAWRAGHWHPSNLAVSAANRQQPLFQGDSAGPYIYLDIGLYSGPNGTLNNGWYSRFNSLCQTGSGTGGENQSLNLDVFNGFRNYLVNDTTPSP